jgi:hypothetical protein
VRPQEQLHESHERRKPNYRWRYQVYDRQHEECKATVQHKDYQKDGFDITVWLALFDPRRSFFPEHRISMMCFLLACIGLQAVFLFGQKISKALWGKYPVLFKIFLFSFYFLGSCPGVL